MFIKSKDVENDIYIGLYDRCDIKEKYRDIVNDEELKRKHGLEVKYDEYNLLWVIKSEWCQEVYADDGGPSLFYSLPEYMYITVDHTFFYRTRFQW